MMYIILIFVLFVLNPDWMEIFPDAWCAPPQTPESTFKRGVPTEWPARPPPTTKNPSQFTSLLKPLPPRAPNQLTSLGALSRCNLTLSSGAAQ